MQQPITLKLGNRTIEETDKYRYIGEINNKRMNTSDQIKAIESKLEVAYQTLIAITEDREFKSIKMESVWLLVNTYIVPIITYTSETWILNKSERKNLNKILDTIIRINPKEAKYI